MAAALSLLAPAAEADEKTDGVDRLVRMLGSAAYVLREEAEKELRSIGWPAAPALRKAAKHKDAEVAMRAKRILKWLRENASDGPSWPSVRTPACLKRLRQHRDWRMALLLGDYRRIGHRDPRWNADAEAAISAAVDYWHRWPWRPGDEWHRMREHSRQAIRAGCKDELVRYINAVADELIEKPFGQEKFRATIPIGKLALTSRYNAAQRILMMLRGIDYAWGPHVLRQKRTILQAILKLLPELARMPGLPFNMLREIVSKTGQLAVSVLGDKGKARLHVDAVLATIKLDAARRTALEAYLLWGLHPDAHRGTASVARNPSPRKRALYQKVGSLLEKAWQMDQSLGCDLCVGRLRLLATVGAARSEMETWFRRAMESDAGCDDACSARDLWLEWNSKNPDAARLAFGRQCLKSGNWNSKVPLVLLMFHYYQGEGMDDGTARQYLSRPRVWADIEAVCEGYLKRYPKRHQIRSFYASLAAKAGKWKIAEQQFKLLGKYAMPSHFGGRANLAMIRRRVAREVLLVDE